MRRTRQGIALLGSLLLLTAPTQGSFAAAVAEVDLGKLRETLDRQERQIEEHARHIERQQNLLDRQRRELLRLRELVEGASPATGSTPRAKLPARAPKAPRELSHEPVSPKQPRSLAARPDPSAPREPDTEVGLPERPGTDVAARPDPSLSLVSQRPKSERPQEELLRNTGGVLLRRGALQLEPSIDYTHFSGDRVAINGLTILEAITIGEIRVDRLDRDIIETALNLRYGLTDRLQLEARFPNTYRNESEVLAVGTGDARERNTRTQGMGDIDLGVLWHAVRASDSLPDIILRSKVRLPTGKSPFDIDLEVIGPGGQRRLREPATGSGFYGISTGFTGVWRYAPAVFYAGGGYTWNLERDVGSGTQIAFVDPNQEERERPVPRTSAIEYGTIDPGDVVDAFIGMNVALSERLSLSFSFVDQYTFHSYSNGFRSPGSSFNDGRLVVGASLGLSPKRALLVSASVGLTAQSPDFQIGLKMPINFDLSRR